MKSSFDLVPFSTKNAPAIAISGNISFQNNQLEIEYNLTGNLSQLTIAKPVMTQTRQDNLWQHTCFEFFLGIKDTSKYWEFNLSPAGHWNVFCLANYRQDLAEEVAVQALPFQVRQQSDLLQLKLEFNLAKIIDAEQNLEVGIATVIENQEQQLSYWALNHPSKEADFHHRDSFIVQK